MRAAVYNPYLDTLGGGERYTLTFAKVLVEKGFVVDVYWNDIGIKNRLEDRFGLDLSGVNIVEDIKKGDGYDLCFWVSDGSIPLLRSRKNILHFQVPFSNVNGKTLINKMKLFRINEIVCNSNFTKKIIDSEFAVDSTVLYPPVDVENIRPLKKQNIILFVGRFSQLKQAKRQDILIKAFKKLTKNSLKKWKLIIAGGIEVGMDKYLDQLREMSNDLNVKIIESPSYKELTKLYGISKIFWSASGYQINEQKDPDRVEHFGITIVEAMAAGCIPLIYNAGGHKEIVSEGIDGFLWQNTNELLRKTRDIIKRNIFETMLPGMLASSKRFGYDNFSKNVSKLL